MRIGSRGISLIKEFEGCRLESYQCPAKVWTIGIGHTGTVLGRKICKGMKITESHAIKILKSDMKKYEAFVNQYVKVPLTQNQFDALVSFCFNVGGYSLKNSTLLRKLNSGDYQGAAAEFLKWNKADTDGDGKLEVLNGLTKRRKAEQALFNLK